MKVIIDKSVIGKTVCYLERSLVSDAVICHTHKVTAYMVERGEDEIFAKVRLDNGKWIKASSLFYPEEEAAARKRLAEKFNQN